MTTVKKKSKKPALFMVEAKVGANTQMCADYQKRSKFKKMLAEFIAAKEAAAKADRAKKVAAKGLKDYMAIENVDRALADGWRVDWVKILSQKLDQKQLVEDHPKLAAEYYYESESQPFKVSKA
jgi:hypothetical protein